MATKVCGEEPAGSIRGALPAGKMRFEVAGEEFERAFDGRSGHGDEITKPFTFIESQNFAELFQDRLAALSLLNLLHQHGERVCFHTASRTLTAGFSREKLGDSQNLFDDASSFADETDDPATKAGAGFSHSVGFQRRIELVRR